MFLAIKEIKHEKLRYSLITGMILLVSYLVFILSGLSNGLQTLNSAAIESWNVDSIVLNKDAQKGMPQSILTQDDINQLPRKNSAKLVQTAGLLKGNKDHKKSIQIVGIDKDEFIYKNLKPDTGNKFKLNNEVVVSNDLKLEGFKIGDIVTFSNTNVKLKIVGFVKNANLSIAPVVYSSIKMAQTLSNKPNIVNGVVLKTKASKIGESKSYKAYDIDTFIKALPGNNAQTLTFNFMIGFLLVIILIVITIFLYILTMQKLPNFGVMKAQGISTTYLAINTLFQSFLVTVTGVLGAAGLTAITAVILPQEVPIAISASYVTVTAILIIVMSLLGTLIPIREIVKVDPYKIIGG